VVVVVLDSQNIASDARVLLDFAFSNYSWVPAPDGMLPTIRSGDKRVTPRLDTVAAVAVLRWEAPEMRTRVVTAADGQGGQPGLRLVVESGLRRLGAFALAAREAVP